LAEVTENVYNDDYATCEQTYVTLCLYHDDLGPEVVSQDLGLQPTLAHKRGEIRNAANEQQYAYKTGGWFLESTGVVHSRDVRRHIDWLLDLIEPKLGTLKRLRAAGYATVVSCFWVSAHWHGGPMLCPAQLARLAALGLEVWFDIYFSPSDETDSDEVEDYTELAPPPTIADRELETDRGGASQRFLEPAGHR
jgi:Domain of unknown function (DUF4279)